MKSKFQFFRPKNFLQMIKPSKEAQIQMLQKQAAQLQASLDILISGYDEARTTSTEGNPYRDSKTAITALAEKYDGKAKWGVQQVRNLVDIRAAFTVGQGFKIVEDESSPSSKTPESNPKDNVIAPAPISGTKPAVPKPTGPKQKTRELEFIQNYVKENNLDEEMAQELSKEAEIEGRILVVLVPAPERESKIKHLFIPWTDYKYEVISNPKDYEDFIEVKYKDPISKEDVVVKKGDFIYKKFAGRLGKNNDIMPKLAMLLRHVEDLDKALDDYRRANRLFATPTPYFKVTNANDVAPLLKLIEAMNWSIGKVFAGTADFSLVGAPAGSLDSLMKEIECLAKIISGGSGVPIHFLGFTDLMSNRSTSTDLFELINASVNKERHIWEGFYQELFDRVIQKSNGETKKDLKTGQVKAQVLVLTEAQLRLLVEIWLPLYTAGIIDIKYFLGKIPDLNPEDFEAAQDEAAQKMLESVRLKEKSAAANNEDPEEDPEEE